MNGMPILAHDLVSASSAAFGASPLLHALSWTLAHFIWQGCVLAAAFALATLALRRASASSRYLAGCATMTMMACTPLATFAWLWRASPSSPLAPFSNSAGGGVSNAASMPFERAQLAIVAVWLAGVVACSIWLLGGWLNVRRYRRLESLPMPRDLDYRIARLAETLRVRCVVRVVDHLAVAAPLTLGALKPVILLPASMLTGLSRAQLQAIIAHEMAHIRRMDFLVNLLQSALEALLFYHPAVWWVSRQVRQEREYCCDDLAADVCGNVVTYARALAHLESLRSDGGRGPGLVLSSQGGSLMKRIARLLDTQSPRTLARPLIRPGSAGATWTAGVGFALLIAASSAVALVKPPVQSSPVPQPPAAQEPEIVVQGRSTVTLLPLVEGIWVASPDSTNVTQCEGVDLTLDFQGEMAGEGTWTLLDDASQAVEVTGQAVLSDMLEIRFAAVPTIDPERMPSDGLVKAAQMAYPFNLLGLMSWVAPEAQEVLVKPTVDPEAYTVFLRTVHTPAEGRSISLVPTLKDLPIVGGVRMVERPSAQVRPSVNLRRAKEGVMIENVDASPIVTVDGVAMFEFEPVTLEATNTIPATLEGEVAGFAATATPAEPAKPAEKPAPEPAQPKP